MEQENLREWLLQVINLGLSARAIAEHTGINYDILAKYKQGRLLLVTEDANKLEKYLGQVYIPKSI
jgi:ribosome-binding protein aMBF1 (putative translation factor)